MFELRIHGGRLVTPSGERPADLAVSGGRIVATLAPGEPAQAAETLDATGCLVLPGVIDAHVHFREPGLTHKEDWEHGSAAAVAGGVTTVLDMPNVVPPTATAGALTEKAARIAGRSRCHFGLYGALAAGADPPEAQAGAGAVGFKVFLGETTASLPPPDDGALLAAWRRTAALGLRTMVHAENGALLRAAARWADREAEGLLAPLAPRSGQGVAATRPEAAGEGAGRPEGASEARVAGGRFAMPADEDAARVPGAPGGGAMPGGAFGAPADGDLRLHALARPAIAETEAVARACLLAAEAGAPIAVAHLSSRGGVAALRRAKADGADARGEACPHHLLLTGKQAQALGALAKVNPPLRALADRDALWAAVADGTIDQIGSDHAPHAPEERAAGVRDAPAGFAGVQNTLVTLLGDPRLPLLRLVELLCAGPARNWGLWPAKGRLAPGADADIVVVRPAAPRQPPRQWSRNPDSPVVRLCAPRAEVVATVVGGRVAFRDGEPVGTPAGRWVRP